VEVSDDNGQNWHEALLGQDRAKYAWRIWRYSWRPTRAGVHALAVRATDSSGRVQPPQPSWNPSGYLWNGYDRINIDVKA